jgi:hypothetical protein
VRFFAHHSHVDTSQKEKKMQKKIMHPATRDPRCRRKKRVTTQQERKEKEEKRRKKPTIQAGQLAATHLRWVSPAVGLRDPSLFRQRVCSGRGGFLGSIPFLLHRLWVPEGSRRRSEPPRGHLAASRPQATETHSWVSPAVGLFFFFFSFRWV